MTIVRTLVKKLENLYKTNNKPKNKERYVWADLDCWTATVDHETNSCPSIAKTIKVTLQSLMAIVESKEPEIRSFRCPSVAVVRQLTPRGS